MLREALARHGAYRLDAVVITHGDDDHKGSLASLAGVVDVRRVLVAQDALACSCEACVSLVADARKLAGDGESSGSAGRCACGGLLRLARCVATSGSPTKGATPTACALSPMRTSTATAHPVACAFHGRRRARPAARAHRRRASGLRRPLQGGPSRIQERPRRRSWPPRSPLASLVLWARNRYGHPAQDTLDRLEAAGARVFRTDEQGDVSCKLTADRIEVDTLR